MAVDGRPVPFAIGRIPPGSRRDFLVEFNRLGGTWGRVLRREDQARAEAFAIATVEQYVTTTAADGVSGAEIVRRYARTVISSLLAQVYLQNILTTEKARRRIQALGLAGAYRMLPPRVAPERDSHV